MDAPGIARQPARIDALQSGAKGVPRAATAGIVVLLLVALGAAYWSTLASPFVFDDHTGIVDNPTVHNLSDAFRGAWSHNRGLTDLTFALNYSLHGLDVRGYHVTNLLIHFLAGLTLFGLVRRTLQSDRLRDRYGPAATTVAAIIALLWMVHPLQTQAVTYIVQRHESLMGLFYLLTLYSFRRGVDDRDRWWLVLSVICFALGARSKEVMFTAPFVVLWYDRVFVSTSWRNLLSRKFYYLALAIVSVCMLGPAVLQVAQGLWSQIGSAPKPTPSAGQVDPSVLFVQGMTPWTYLATQPRVILHYLQLSFLPLHQCADYGWPVAQGWGEILPPALAIGCLLLFSIWALFRRPEWAFLSGCFFLILLPTSSIVPIQDVAVEHRMYLPLAALVAAVVLAAYSVLLRFNSSTKWGYAAATIAAVALVSLTVARNQVYRTNEAFWRDVVLREPTNVRGRTNLGLVLCELHRYDEGLQEYQAAIKLKPSYAFAHYNLGNAYIAQGQPKTAIAAYLEAIRFWPSYAGAYNNLGFAFSSLDRQDDARQAFEQALKLKPNYAGAYLNLGLLEAKQGNLTAAQEAYRQAILLDPTSAEAHHNLGLVLSREQKWREALEEWDLALSIRPDYAKAHQNAGMVLMQIGQYRGAVEQLREAVRLQPGDAAALRALGDAFTAAGNPNDARSTYLKVLEIDPKNALAEAGLAALALKAEDLDSALMHLKKSLEIDPSEGGVQHELANLLVRTQRYDEAANAFAKAVELLPEDPAVRVNFARLAEKLNQQPRAIELYQQALAIDSNFAPAHFNLGFCLASQKRSAEAIEKFLTAIRLDPNYAEAHFALGNAFARTGQLELALERYRIVLRLRPNFAPAQENAQQVLKTLRARAGKPGGETASDS